MSEQGEKEVRGEGQEREIGPPKRRGVQANQGTTSRGERDRHLPSGEEISSERGGKEKKDSTGRTRLTWAELMKEVRQGGFGSEERGHRDHAGLASGGDWS